jgi:DeoR/GlpR family transcriptional regulator of sugar metabolism
MIEAERHRLIRKLVDERSIVSLTELVEILGASEATVRRDIGALAELGQITRIRGGAESVRPRHEVHLVGSPFALSKGVAVAEKRAIAKAAAQLIAPGDSLIISGGTTTYALVEFLPPENLDILTNSMPLVTRLLATSRNRITVPGGTIYREQNIVLSPFEDDASPFLGQDPVHQLPRTQPLRDHGGRSTDRAITDAITASLRAVGCHGRSAQAAATLVNRCRRARAGDDFGD